MNISDISNMQDNRMHTHILETLPIHLPVEKECLWLRLQPLFPEPLSKYFLQVREVQQQGQSRPGRAVRGILVQWHPWSLTSWEAAGLPLLTALFLWTPPGGI